MKVVVNDNKTDQPTTNYPRLKQSTIVSGRIVLFTAPQTGVVLCPGPEKSTLVAGYYSNTWNEDIFENFTGEVILSND